MTQKKEVVTENKPSVVKVPVKACPRIYIGPSFRGVLTGTVYKTDLPPALENVIKKTPAISELVVPIEFLTEANRELSKTDSALRRIYQMAEEIKRGE